MSEVKLHLRYPDSKPSDITDAYMRGVEVGRTLGHETCHADETETWQGVCMSKPIRYVCNLTIHVMECSACGRTYEHVNGVYEYCPHCGRRIEVDA